VDVVEGSSVVPVPLAEAVIEIRFAGDARIESLRGEFQQYVKGELPALYVPKSTSDDAVAMRPYKFSSETGTEAALLSVNLFAYATQEYRGWEAFKESFLGYWRFIGDRIEPQAFTRVATRYINRFDTELAAKMRVLDGPPWLAPLSLSPISHKSMTRLRLQSGYDATIQVGRDEADGTLTLDLDVYARDVQVGMLLGVLGDLHSNLEAVFSQSIAPDYADDLRLIDWQSA